MGGRPRLLVLSMRNVFDPNAKAHYSMTQALRKHCGEIIWLNPCTSTQRSLAVRFRERVLRRPGRNTVTRPSFAMAEVAAQRTQEFLARTDCDAVLAPNGAHLLPCLKTGLPIIYTSDATRRLIDGYYPSTVGTSLEQRQELEAIERAALARVDLAIACTHWAARSMEQDYGVAPERIAVVNSGASLDWAPTARQAVRKQVGQVCRLLLVGGEWDRKGCDIAVGAHVALRQMGVPSELTICGCVPPSQVSHEGLKIIARLDKSKLLQRRRLYRLYSDSHFFIFPTRAECFGLAVGEANANGLPAIASDTGGVPEAVLDGVNGYVMAYDAPPKAYAQKIAEIWSSPDRYRELVASSRREYDTRLNWDVWGQRVAGLVQDLLRCRAERELQ